VHELDNVQAIRQIDRSNMLDKIHRMPEHLTEAITGFKKLEQINRLTDVDNIALVGMGTSAIAAEIALDWLSDHLKMPTTLIRDSGLPSFSNERTMILTISYSGNTQETLEALVNALHQKCRVVTISSGGNMKRISETNGIPHIDIKPGLEPRTAFPFLFVASALTLALLSDKEDAEKEIREASDNLRGLRNRIGWNVAFADNPAKQLAVSLLDSIPVAYAFRKNGGFARRFKNQLNENCKMPVMLSILPEACHNELEAWSMVRRYSWKFSHIFLRVCESDEESIRIEETQRSLSEVGAINIHEVRGEGNTRVSQLLSVTYFIDYVSFYLGVLRGIDPTPWEKIQELKKRILLKTHFKEKLEGDLKSH
jgi:glucose/mannose-6-phosphate isomerase